MDPKSEDTQKCATAARFTYEYLLKQCPYGFTLQYSPDSTRLNITFDDVVPEFKMVHGMSIWYGVGWNYNKKFPNFIFINLAGAGGYLISNQELGYKISGKELNIDTFGDLNWLDEEIKRVATIVVDVTKIRSPRVSNWHDETQEGIWTVVKKKKSHTPTIEEFGKNLEKNSLKGRR